jgi:hypothetical protein
VLRGEFQVGERATRVAIGCGEQDVPLGVEHDTAVTHARRGDSDDLSRRRAGASRDLAHDVAHATPGLLGIEVQRHQDAARRRCEAPGPCAEVQRPRLDLDQQGADRAAPEIEAQDESLAHPLPPSVLATL